jgi:hypothetical protein
MTMNENDSGSTVLPQNEMEHLQRITIIVVFDYPHRG